MDLDFLDNQDKLTFSSILSNLDRVISNTSVYLSDLKTSDDIRDLMRKWYVKGYMKALDDYKKLIG